MTNRLSIRNGQCLSYLAEEIASFRSRTGGKEMSIFETVPPLPARFFVSLWGIFTLATPELRIA